MYAVDLAVRHATNGVIFDTNVLLVFLIGLWNPVEISKYKRTASYTEKDFMFLASVLEHVGRLVTTPHILTEVCNLSDTLNRQHGYALYQLLADLQKRAGERRQEAVRLMANPLYLHFGLADTSLIDASRKHHLVITDEAACYAAIANSGGLVLNMNHLRSAEWLQARAK